MKHAQKVSNTQKAALKKRMFIIRKLTSKAEISETLERIQTENILSTPELMRSPEPKLTNMRKEKRELVNVDEKEDDVLFFGGNGTLPMFKVLFVLEGVSALKVINVDLL